VTSEGAEVTVRSLAGGGDGVATLDDGRAVFIPRAAVGDRLRLRAIQLHARYARAAIDEVLVAGPGRVEPPCPHYLNDRCGGCQLMHLDAPTQRAAKSRIAGDALRRIGRLEVEDPSVSPSPDPFGYRTRITLTIWRGLLGYHQLNDAVRVFDLRTCLIARPEIREVHAVVRNHRSLLPGDGTRVAFRLDRDGGRHVVVSTPEGASAWTGAKALHRALSDADLSVCIWWHPAGGRARALAGAETPWPATVFEQVHPAMGNQVRAAAIDALGSVRGQVAWDLYAGIGETTAALAPCGAEVVSVERDRAAVDLAVALGPAGPDRRTGRVEDVVSNLPPATVVVTNPPRTGMAAAVTDALAASAVSTIAYISCDPATLARDLQRLALRFRVRSVTAYDQFPQTAHLETLAILERR
jgi:23S rRNA (uracil1939-C5)-methyltransferase